MSRNPNFRKMQLAEVDRLKQTIDRKEAKVKALPKGAEHKPHKEKLNTSLYKLKLRFATMKARVAA